MTRLTYPRLEVGRPNEPLTHLDPDPIPSYEESVAASAAAAAPKSGLQILAATWGGVMVTPDIQALVQKGAAAEGDDDKLVLDMRAIYKHLAPDPAPGKTKVLTVLYRFYAGRGGGGDAKGYLTGQGGEAGKEEDGPLCLLCVSEDAQPSRAVITRRAAAEAMTADAAAEAQLGLGRARNRLHIELGRPWRAPGPEAAAEAGAGAGTVEILAVVYGPRRVEAPDVLAQLGRYFEGRRGQIRMTNGFFGADPWPYKPKSWSVFFRFAGSDRVQVVTGWENGALEVPWSRYY